MKPNQTKAAMLLCAALLLQSGCAKLDPRRVDIDIPAGIPEVKTTELNQALRGLGTMAEIYGERTRVMLDKITDHTGTAEHTEGEIPFDVTEMTATALNSIGGSVAFIPYRPDLMINLKTLGYGTFKDKFVPSVLVTGGITEFDRGLETKETSSDFGYETTELGEKTPLGLDFMKGEKRSAARITIDYNMIDVATMSGLAGIQAANSMQVHKGIGEKELGLTIFGPSIGLKGEVKKVEGRHAAVRLLVQTSMIQLIGKCLDLPYWRLLPGASPDPVVESYVSRAWHYQMNEAERVRNIQELLFLHGYEAVELNGEVGPKTGEAVKQFAADKKCADNIGFELYAALYYNVPLDEAALQRRYELARREREERLRQQAAQAEAAKAEAQSAEK